LGLQKLMTPMLMTRFMVMFLNSIKASRGRGKTALSDITL